MGDRYEEKARETVDVKLSVALSDGVRKQLMAVIAAALREVEREERERCAALVDEAADPMKDSAVGELSATAFNDLEGKPMSARIKAWGDVVSMAIRATQSTNTGE